MSDLDGVADDGAEAGGVDMAVPPTGAAGAPERTGLPWEVEGGQSLSGLIETVRLVLFRPAEAFQRAFTQGSLGAPLIFLVALGTTGTFFGLFWQSLSRSLLSALIGSDFGGVASANVMSMMSFLLAPVLVLLSGCLLALLYHLFLLLFGGTERNFEATLRVVCYANGAAWVWLAIPACGGIVSAVWGVVVAVIGMREMHEVPPARAMAAVLVPFLILTCIYMIVAIAMASVAIGTMGMAP